MKRGRPLILEKRGISAAKVIRAYQLGGSTRKAAALLRVSNWRIWHTLHESGQKMNPSGLPASDRWTGGRSGAVDGWARKHPDIALPTRADDLAVLCDVSLGAARFYLKKRLRPLYALRRAAVDIRRLPIALRAEDGRVYATASVLSYRIKVERKTVSLRIEAILRSGKEVCFRIREADLPSFTALLSAGPYESEPPSD
jgi:hypothetical protein